MPWLSCILILALQGSSPESSSTHGFLPTGSAVELHDLGLMARLRDPRIEAVGFSSYDRTGGNNDGFNGTYSRLRAEGNNSVLAETSGPGIIQRIWFTHSSGEKPGLLDGKAEHLCVYLDGAEKPVLDIPLESIFSGKHPHFPNPLASEGAGGFVSYVPIPFRKGCKVLVEGLGVRFYQINMIRLPSADGLSTFTAIPSETERIALENAVSLWSRSEGDSFRIRGSQSAEYVVETPARGTSTWALPDGPATVRELEVSPAKGTESIWRRARLRLIWDRDEPGDAGLDLPLGLVFGAIEGASAYQSVLIGQREGHWYNRFPMPYRRQAILQIDSEQPLQGLIRVRTVAGIDLDAGYFRSMLREAAPPRAGADFNWLDEVSRGHFAGVLMQTEGRATLPYWLEGDDRFTIDGRLAIHGTGSEDYFNCGWYALKGRLDGPAVFPVHGFPVYHGHDGVWQVAAFRWHLSDPVPFARSLVAGIEHGGDNAFPAGYKAAVFWYSDQPGHLRGPS